MTRRSIVATLIQSGFFDGLTDRPPIPSSHLRHSLSAKEEAIDRTLAEAKLLLSRRREDAPQEVVEGLDFIHRHLFDESLNANAVYAAVPSPKLRVRFVKATGVGVRAYIEDARLLVAARLLSYPDLELYLIADALGYAHYETFFRAFKRHFGCSPTVYRETATSTRQLAFHS